MKVIGLGIQSTFGGGLKAAQVLTGLPALTYSFDASVVGYRKVRPSLERLSRLKRLPLPHRVSSLTAVSCGVFLDFRATGKLGETPSARAEWSVRSACKNAPASECTTRTETNGNLADLKETISRLSKSVREPKEVLFPAETQETIYSEVQTLNQTYKKYLRSGHWRALRKRKLEDIESCICCDLKIDLHVHHIRYKNLIDCELSDLTVLCFRCHGDLHDALELSGKSSEEFGPFDIIALLRWYRTLSKEEYDRMADERGLRRRNRKRSRKRQLKAFQDQGRNILRKVSQSNLSLQMMQFAIEELRKLIVARKEIGI